MLGQEKLGKTSSCACVMTRLGKLSYPVTLLANDVASQSLKVSPHFNTHTHTDTGFGVTLISGAL